MSATHLDVIERDDRMLTALSVRITDEDTYGRWLVLLVEELTR